MKIVTRHRIAFLLPALAAAAAVPAAAHSGKDLEAALMERERYVQVTDAPAPGFTLQDAEGRDVSLDDFRGKVVVLNFIYARCKDVCPLQSAVIASIQETINATPLRKKVGFLSIATDTEDRRETADIMRSYASRFGLDPENWMFLYRGAGPEKATIELAERYGLKFRITGDGDQVHGVVTYLIDGSGIVRARYHGLRFDPANLIRHVKALADSHDPEDAHAPDVPAAADRPGAANRPAIAAVAAVAGLVLAVAAVLFFRMRRRRIAS